MLPAVRMIARQAVQRQGTLGAASVASRSMATAAAQTDGVR